MKKIVLILMVLAVVLDSFSAHARQLTTKIVKDVNLRIAFQSCSGCWGLDVYPDNESLTETNEMNNEGWMGPLYAAGGRKIRIGTNYLKITPGGTWEVVAYTDNISQIELPYNWYEMSPNQKIGWIESHSGLFSDVDLDNDGRPDLNMPIKIRSEGIHGFEDGIGWGFPATVGSEISDEDWQGDSAQFSYVGEKIMETEFGYPLTRVAKIGVTDLRYLGRVQIRYGIYEGLAGDELYTGKIYYELRGN